MIPLKTSNRNYLNPIFLGLLLDIYFCSFCYRIIGVFHSLKKKVLNFSSHARLSDVFRNALVITVFWIYDTNSYNIMEFISEVDAIFSTKITIWGFCGILTRVTDCGGKQWQTTPKNLPRMQRTRAIPVTWLSSGLCPDQPKSWIPTIKNKQTVPASTVIRTSINCLDPRSAM
jgi:hypothetical protein